MLQDNVESYQSAEPAENQDKKAMLAHKLKIQHLVECGIYSLSYLQQNQKEGYLELTAELNLTGFTLPGKPGYYCS